MVRSFHLAVLIQLVASSAFAQDKPLDVPISGANSKIRLIGKLHEPLGTVVTVQGIVVEGPFLGYEGGPNLRVQRINGKATQEDIQIRLTPYFNAFGEKRADGHALPRLSFGNTYEFEGYETGEFVGVPSDAYERANRLVQTTGFYFCHELKVYLGKQIDPIVWSPADFLDKTALIAGRAVSEDGKSYIAAQDWKLLVDAKSPWPDEVVGKEVEGRGTIRKSASEKSFLLEGGATRMVRLEDQLGRKVSLRGTPWSVNDNWWFNYRGIEMYVDHMEEMPGWSRNLRCQAVLIEGVLEEAILPAVEGNLGVFDAKPKKYFIVRRPTWKPTDTLLSPEVSSR